jgi:hypothetical protein
MPKATHSTLPADAELVLPEQVTIALAEPGGIPVLDWSNEFRPCCIGPLKEDNR